MKNEVNRASIGAKKTNQLFSSSARHRFLLLMLTIFTCGSAVGATKALSFGFSKDFKDALTEWTDAEAPASKTYTLGSTDYTFALGAHVYYNSGYLMLQKTTYLGLPAISGKKLTKVVVNNSGGCSVSTNVAITSNTSGTAVSGGTAQTFSTKGSEYTYDLSSTANNTVYYLYITSANCQITRLRLFYSDGAGGDLVYERVSSVGALADGDKIIFVNQNEDYSCSTTQNTNNRAIVPIVTLDHQYIYNSDDNVQVYTVKINASSEYGFHDGNGYLYSASASSNYLKTNTTILSTSPSGTSAWSMTASSSVFTIINVTNTAYYMQFNGTTNFSQFKNTSQDPYIYKLTNPWDTYVDLMHDNEIPNKVNSYTVPNLSNETLESNCVGQHYKFVGWVAKSDLNADGTLKSGYTLVLPGTAKTANLTTYFAIWAKEVE